jgi:RHS repeat-associated protein
MLALIEPQFSVSRRMIYTADDERIGTIYDSGSAWTIRGFDKKVLTRFRSSTNDWVWEQDYVYANGQLVGGDRELAHGGRRHHHLDHLGSVRMTSSDSRTRYAINDYYPFGIEQTPLTQEDTNFGYGRPETMKFTGHERDFIERWNDNSSEYLDYMHARYYNLNWGRFLSVDPVLDQNAALKSPQMWNRYAYVRNNPINATDPTGRREAMVYGQIRDVEPGDVVLLRSKATGRIVHIAVIGDFKSVKGQKLPNALVWENAPAKGDKNNSRGRIADSSPHQPSLVDSNSTGVGGVAGWNKKNMDVAGTLANRDLLGAGPRSLALRPFTSSEVARAALAVGPVTYNNQWAGASGPICDCAGFANQVLNNLGGTLTGRTFLTRDGLTINEWADQID